MEKLTKEWFYHQYVVLRRGTKSIAEEIGCRSFSTVTRWLRKFGIPVRGCAPLKRDVPKGENHSNFKGAKYITREGYVKVGLREKRGTGRYEFEHRRVMAEMMRRPLKPIEVVHHIDGDKQNNHPDNLQLCASQSEHAKLGIEGQRKYAKLWNRDWLWKQYVECERTLKDIAQEVGCTEGAVRNALVRQNIPRRRYTFSKIAIEARVRGGHAKKPRQRQI